MTDKISDKDRKDWEAFLSKDDKLENKDVSLSKQKIVNIKSIDLHGYSLDEANTAIEKLINNCFTEGVSKIVVVTGKGLHSQNDKDPYVSKDLGILKHSVPEFIKKNINLIKKINKFEDANIEDGGSGAFYIYLKKNLL
ncbi:Smr/MutS family protein [Pelagibacterales bacterium SAG-MED13]|nr:Smr/MutS family protein [Pelagibacterales bacterium SAG-MED13]